MIIDLFINVILSLISVIFFFLPVVTIADIPYIGEATSNALYSAIGVWNAFLITFPYAVIVWNVFLLVIIPFELLLLIAKFFMGNRIPAHTTN